MCSLSRLYRRMSKRVTEWESKTYVQGECFAEFSCSRKPLVTTENQTQDSSPGGSTLPLCCKAALTQEEINFFNSLSRYLRKAIEQWSYFDVPGSGWDGGSNGGLSKLKGGRVAAVAGIDVYWKLENLSYNKKLFSYHNCLLWQSFDPGYFTTTV